MILTQFDIIFPSSSDITYNMQLDRGIYAYDKIEMFMKF